MSHEWGNYPENFTPKMYWGARAILERDSGGPGKALYLLPDRQSFERLDGSQRDQDTFFDWINTNVLPELRRFARENRFYEWSDLVTIQSEDGSFMCQATPKGSCGEYLYIGCWEVEQQSTITKLMLRTQLQHGHTLNNLLAFGPGQDCEIFKADKFYPGDVVIYVPDVHLNHIPLDRSITDPEELEEVLSQCYTDQDFIDECQGDVERAGRLFCYCDWQHPSAAVDELEDDPGQVEIMLSDLLPEAQKEVMRVLGIRSPEDGNYDVTPLFIVFYNGDSAIDELADDGEES